MKKRESILFIGAGTVDAHRWCDGLVNQGIECIAAVTEREGYVNLERKRFQAVMVDADHGGTDLNDFVRILRKRHAETAIIVITGGDDQRVVELIRMGVDQVISRDIDEALLKDVILRARERRRMTILANDRERTLDRENRRLSREVDHLKQQTDRNFTDTLKTFVGLMDTRDHLLGSHSKRVAMLAREVAEHYDLTERVRGEIELAALLHDIGKIGIPDQLLAKTRDYFNMGLLTKRERAAFEKHPVIGQEAIEMIDTTQHLGLYIRHHHERFDGSGYPDGLKGFFIPLGARIIAVVDAYDRVVMQADSQNRQQTRNLFFKYLRKHAGTLFDTEAAKYLVQVLREQENRKLDEERRVSIEDLAPGMVLARDVFSISGVLLISQYERLSATDIQRLHRFSDKNMIMSGVYVYGAAGPSSSGKGKTAPAAHRKLEKVEDINFEKVRTKIGALKDLGTLPALNEAVKACFTDPKSTRDDVTAVLKRDPVMVLKMLRIANSAIFGYQKNVTTIEEAIPLLGFNEVRGIVTSLPLLDTVDKGGDPDIFDRADFWKHCIGCAVIARIIAEKTGAEYPEEYFTAGLLHDVGKLLLDQLYPVHFREAVRRAHDQTIFMRKAERSIFGRPHQEYGAYLLRKWNLPEVLTDTVLHHHSPVDSTADPDMASAVHLADIVTHMLRIGVSGEQAVPKYEQFAARQLNISLADFETLVPEIDAQVKKSSGLLMQG